MLKSRQNLPPPVFSIKTNNFSFFAIIPRFFFKTIIKNLHLHRMDIPLDK